MSRLVVIASAGALVLAGCGGGGTTPGGGGGPGDTTSSAYQAGYSFCEDGTLEELALNHSAVDETPEAIAQAVGESVASNEEELETAKQACLDALEARGLG